MQHILITLGDTYDGLSPEMLQALVDEGYKVSEHPTNADFDITEEDTDNPHLWRALPAVIRAAESTKSIGRNVFLSDCYGPTSKIVSIPDDVNWRIARDHTDREFVEEIHRTWR